MKILFAVSALLFSSSTLVGATGGASVGAALARIAVQVASVPTSVKSDTLRQINKAESYTGVTAAEKINACLAAVGSSGICDATGLAGPQSMDTTVEIGNTCSANGQTSAMRQTLILDQSTVFQPTVAGMTMFQVDCNGSLLNAHILIPRRLNFTGKAVQIVDTITNQNINSISIDGLQVDAGTYSAGGYGLYIAPPVGGWIQLVNFHNIRIQGLANGIYFYTTGTGSYINGNNFSDVVLEGSGNLLVFNAEANSLQISGNTFTNLQTDGSGPAISFMGTAPIQQNTFSPAKIWDTPSPVVNSNRSALRNLFVGSIDNPVTDPGAAFSKFPYQNVYLTSTNGGWSSFNGHDMSVTGAPGWKNANAGTFGWNYTGREGEVDYFQDAYTGGSYAHAFYAANSSNTGWKLLGGLSPAGDWKNANGVLLKATDVGVHGMTGSYVQKSDGTGKGQNMAMFDASGNVSDSSLAVTAVPQNVTYCGTTSICANFEQKSPRIIWGVVNLRGGTAAVARMTAWTSSSSFVCTGTDQTSTAAVKIVNTSTTSIKVTGTGSDVVAYTCVGN